MPPPMIDTHCHLDVPAFADDVDAAVARATSAGVIGMLVPAIRPSMWPALAALVERHRDAGLRLAIGVHPQIVPELAPGEIGGIDDRAIREQALGRIDDRAVREQELARIDDRAIREQALGRIDDRAIREQALGRIDDRAIREQELGVVDDRAIREQDIDAIAAWIAREASAYRAIAIGECGLDGATGDMPRQEALFRAHLRAARITGLPLVVHVLRAHDAAPRILREELSGPRTSEGDRPLQPAIEGDRPLQPATLSGARTSASDAVVGVLHSYSGGADLVGVYRDLGFAFSFAGPVSYANARKPVEAARVIPPELLLAETDAPDQAPEGHRGGRSEPAFVAAVIAGLAAARAQTAEEIAALTTANARRIFRSWE
ncbi:MAG: TatD family hydrolase [Kofleriaceae bacterium]